MREYAAIAASLWSCACAGLTEASLLQHMMHLSSSKQAQPGCWNQPSASATLRAAGAARTIGRHVPVPAPAPAEHACLVYWR
jgi:hypothetical protein